MNPTHLEPLSEPVEIDGRVLYLREMPGRRLMEFYRVRTETLDALNAVPLPDGSPGSAERHLDAILSAGNPLYAFLLFPADVEHPGDDEETRAAKASHRSEHDAWLTEYVSPSMRTWLFEKQMDLNRGNPTSLPQVVNP